MNLAHHSVYPIWLEMARTELLREQGIAYAQLEAEGVLFVVASLSLRFRRPAYYDQELRVHVQATRTAGVRIEHRYEVRRGDQLLATAQSVLACVDREGKPQPIPERLLPEEVS